MDKTYRKKTQNVSARNLLATNILATNILATKRTGDKTWQLENVCVDKMSQDKTYWQTKLFAKALPDKMYGQTICIGGQKNIGR